MATEQGPPNASWRAALLSKSHGLAAIAVRGGRVHEANAAAWQLFGKRCVGTPVGDLFSGDSSLQLRKLLSTHGSASAELAVMRFGGPVELPFLVLAAADECLMLALSNEARHDDVALTTPPQELSTRIHDLEEATQGFARAKASEERLRSELEDLGRAASAVSDAVVDLPQSDVSTVLHTIALQAQALTRAKYVAIGIGTDPEKPFQPWIALGVSPEVAAAIGRTPRPVGLLGVVAKGGEVVRIDNLRGHHDFHGFPRRHPEMGPLLGVPLHYRGRPVGNLYLANEPGDPAFSENDERLIRMLAARVGVAVETALLYVSERLQRVWLQNIIDQMPDAVLLYDERGVLKAMNQAASELGGDPGAGTDPRGNPIELEVRDLDGQVIAPDDSPLGIALRETVATLRKEALLSRMDERLAPVSISAVPVRDKEGRMAGVTMIIEDISSRKDVERLRQEWVALVGHDLRQPVNVISLAAGMLAKMHEGDWSDLDRRTIERIQSASALLGRMITDLTHASLIESNQLSIDVRSTDLDELVRSAIDGMKNVTAGYGVEVKVEGPSSEIWLDPDRVEQVLCNLVSNAAKYGRPGTDILIEVRSSEDGAEVVVTNRGQGIAPDQLPLLFSRFTRAREARLGKTHGLGLGLYIAKGLVEAHGGRMWAQSIPGETTSFHFTLPARHDEDDPSPRKVPSTRRRGPSAPRLRRSPRTIRTRAVTQSGEAPRRSR